MKLLTFGMNMTSGNSMTLEVEEVRFALKRKKYMGIDWDLYAIIKMKAKTLNKPEDALINEWLSEKATT